MKKLNKMTTQEKLDVILRPLSDEQIDSLSANELKLLLKGEQKLRQVYEEIIKDQKELNKQLEDKQLQIEGQLVRLKCRLFCPQSERSKPVEKNPLVPKEKRRPLPKNRDLRKRYPNAEVIEKEVRLETLPACPCCQQTMKEMGFFEESQHLTVIPKKYLITSILRMKYHCTKCHSAIVTAPQLPRVIPRGSYGDEFLVDVALSKFCDLIPVDRYCEMAARQGFLGLPSNSLYEAIWRLGQFALGVYELIRTEALDSLVFYADETTHWMLEGAKNDHWYLWGFFTETACFFECHDTRAGDVATDVLSESECRYFVSDAYTGYGKAIRESNELRKLAGLDAIIEVLCNAHARRNFNDCLEIKQEKEILINPDAEFFITEYKEIYKVEKEVKALLPLNFDEAAKKRAELECHFTRMKEKSEGDLSRYSSHHGYYGACQYFLNNYTGLSACLKDPRIPLDNNLSERGLRSPVVGRKTWYGTHSEKGAEAMSIHFTLVESCKLNGVNPREYYHAVIDAIHYKRPLFTPSQYKKKTAAAQENKT